MESCAICLEELDNKDYYIFDTNQINEINDNEEIIDDQCRHHHYHLECLYNSYVKKSFKEFKYKISYERNFKFFINSKCLICNKNKKFSLNKNFFFITEKILNEINQNSILFRNKLIKIFFRILWDIYFSNYTFWIKRLIKFIIFYYFTNVNYFIMLIGIIENSNYILADNIYSNNIIIRALIAINLSYFHININYFIILLLLNKIIYN